MKKLAEDNEKSNFQLIGISSLLKDYRLCFFLNPVFEIDFKNVEDHKIIPKGKSTAVVFRTFHAKNDFANCQFFLFANKNEKTETLLSELSKMDYILKITGEIDLTNLIKTIAATEGIESAMILPLKKIKSHHFLEYISEEKTTKTLWQLNKTKQK